MTRTVTWLQISDIHLRSGDAYNQKIVLDSLTADVRQCRDELGLSFDLVFITGDIANAGQRTEYALARKFVEDLAGACELDLDAIYCVPGNHDIDRTNIADPDIEFRSRDEITTVLGDVEKLQTILNRQSNYMEFVRDVFPWAPAIKQGGLSYTINRRVNDVPVSILGLNSTWIGGTNFDRGRLVIGERQIRDALQDIADPAILIALMHHPVSYLADFDATDVHALLNSRCDFVMHGHIHDFGAVGLRSPDSEVFYLAAGATYHDRGEVLSYNIAKIDLDSGDAQIFLRRYSDRQGGFWAPDTGMYKSAPKGVITLPLPERLTRKPRVAAVAEVHAILEQLVPESSESSEGKKSIAKRAAPPVAPEPTPEIPTPPEWLVDQIVKGKCILFAGSGASVDAQLPTWPELVRDLIDDGVKSGQIDEQARHELEKLVAEGRYIPAAGYCREKIGLFDFAHYLRQRLSDSERISATHRLLAQIPFRGAITTNYDKLIEYSRPKATVILPDIMERMGNADVSTLFEPPGTFPVFKISGSLEDVSSVVLTQEDFRKLSYKKPNYIDMIRKLLLSHTVFFYGSGFVDPNVNFILQEILTKSDGNVRPHYALMPEQGAIMRDFWLRNFNVRVISYPLWQGSHIAAKGFLEKLHNACAEKA